MRVLVVTSVPAEAKAIGDGAAAAVVIISGIGRANAAAATTEAIVRDGPFDAVVNAGIAGMLPGSGLDLGEVVVASQCVYAEEGLITPSGFAGVEALGFALGDFSGNAVPVDEGLLARLSQRWPAGPIATVATCSGTDDAAAAITQRTKAIAEAMEGAAVVHAARRLSVPAIELRSISNTTGDRDRQRWDLPRALAALGDAVPRALAALGA